MDKYACIYSLHWTPTDSLIAQLCPPPSAPYEQLRMWGSSPVQLTSSRAWRPLPKPNLFDWKLITWNFGNTKPHQSKTIVTNDQPANTWITGCRLIGPIRILIENPHRVPQSKLSADHSSLSQSEEIIADGEPLTKKVHPYCPSKPGWLKPRQS